MIRNNIFSSDKKEIFVSFPRSDIPLHSTISGLKYYLVVMFMRKHLDTFGEVTFSLNKLLTECGYSTKSHNDDIYQDFKNILVNIIEAGYASSSSDINTLKPNTLCSIYMESDKSIFFSKVPFVQITIDEFEKIVSIPKCKVNRAIVFGVYLYIKQFIYNDSDKKVVKISYPTQQQMAKDLGISSITTIESAINFLEQHYLIYIQKDLYVEDKDTDTLYPARHVYALHQSDLNLQVIISELCYFYKRQVYTKSTIPSGKKFIKQ